MLRRRIAAGMTAARAAVVMPVLFIQRARGGYTRRKQNEGCLCGG